MLKKEWIENIALQNEVPSLLWFSCCFFSIKKTSNTMMALGFGLLESVVLLHIIPSAAVLLICCEPIHIAIPIIFLLLSWQAVLMQPSHLSKGWHCKSSKLYVSYAEFFHIICSKYALVLFFILCFDNAVEKVCGQISAHNTQKWSTSVVVEM